MEFIIGFIFFVLGSFIGFIFTSTIFEIRKVKSGIIFVNSDEDGIYLSLHVKNIEDVIDKKEVILDVVN